MSKFNAPQDNNQVFGALIAQGSAGTAGAGTAETMPVYGDPSTGAMYVYNLGPAGSVSLGDITGGTIDLISSVGGTVAVNVVGGGVGGGAVYAGTPTHPGTVIAVRLSDGTSFYNAGGASDIPGGTIDLISSAGTVLGVGTLTNVGSITNIGMLHGGTVVTTMGDLSGGTIDLITSVTDIANLSKGTITRIEGGTVGLVTTVSNLSAGSVAVTTGTISAFTADIPGGTIDMLSAGTISMLNAGTITTIPNIPGGTIGLVSTVSSVTNLAAGTITRVEGGTITRVSTVGTLEVGTISALPNIPGGTIGVVSSLTTGSIVVTNGTIGAGTVAVSAGTITHGTIDAGTVRTDARTTQNILTYGTQLALGGAAYATIVGSAVVGVGTSTWVQNLSIDNPNANVLCLVGFGTALQGTSVLYRGIHGTTSAIGIQKSWDKPVNAGMTNQDLVCYLGGAGTVDFTLSYFISA